MKSLLVALILTLFAGSARADHDQKAAIDRGTFIETAVITGSSVAGTAFASASIKRMDAVYFNNTATVVWIGSTTATLNGGTHSNITTGIPLLSSATLSLGGVMSGAIAFTCNAGVATCEIRRLEGSNR